MMKRITALILALALAMSLTACKGKNKHSSTGSDLSSKELEALAAQEK